jgi:hypothetical protein
MAEADELESEAAELELAADDAEDLEGVADEVEPAPKSVRRLATEVRARASVFRCTLASVGAWSITVAPLVVTGRAGIATRVLSLVALAPAVAGPQLIARSARLARHVGVTAFLAVTLAAWALASREQVLARVDTFRAVLGVVAWGVFAVSWSHPWSVPDAELGRAPEGETVGLKPRRKPPQRAVAIAVVGAVVAVACLALGWTVSDPSRAVFAQAGATAAAIAMLTSASSIAVLVGRERRRDGRRARLPIDRSVINTLLLMSLVVAAAIALLWTK